jgi:hypothetical protein
MMKGITIKQHVGSSHFQRNSTPQHPLTTHYSPLTNRRLALGVHDFVLMIDTLHMHRIKILGDELFAQSDLISSLESSFQYLVPAIGLKDRDIIVLLVFTNFLSNLHTLTQYLHQFIVEVIDLLT